MRHDRNVQKLLDLVARGHKVSFEAQVRDWGVADPRPFERIVTAEDGGGWRQFLAGRPIHCGSTLELRAHEWIDTDEGSRCQPTGGILEVRYEMDWAGTVTVGEKTYHERRGVLYFDIGGYSFGPKPFDDGFWFRWPKREDD